MNRRVQRLLHPMLRALIRLSRRTIIVREMAERLQRNQREALTDACLEVTERLPLPGWHLLAIQVKSACPMAGFVLVLEHADGSGTGQQLELPVNLAGYGARIIRVKSKLTALRLRRVGADSDFSIVELRTAWLLPWFARERLSHRLSSMHPHWRGTPVDTVQRQLAHEAKARGMRWADRALQDYDETFQRRFPVVDYPAWLAARGEAVAPPPGPTPDLVFLVAITDSDDTGWESTIESLQHQDFPGWRVGIVTSAELAPSVESTVRGMAAGDSRIQWLAVPQTGGPDEPALLNAVIAQRQSRYVAVLHPGDRLAGDAVKTLSRYLADHPDALFLYSDEDRLTAHGERCDPHFKPGWNPDLLYAVHYTGQLAVLERNTLIGLGGWRAERAPFHHYDAALRITQRLREHEIVHIPRALYHRVGSSSACHDPDGQRTDIVTEAVQTIAPGATVHSDPDERSTRVIWPLPSPPPTVSLLIPTRDQVEVLKPCVDAILEKTAYPSLEVVILDNASTCPRTLAYLEAVEQRDDRVRVVGWPHAFNYSAINNFGAHQARGQVFGLINNDIEPVDSDWLAAMVRHALRPEIGCVGAKLHYPDGRIQHGGVILGIGSVAGHAHKLSAADDPGYANRLALVHNLSAVTAACLVVRREVFDAVGGLDAAHLPIAFNDVDFCLRVESAGYRNLWTPEASLIHHESVSRGPDDDPAKRARAEAERQYMRRHWGARLDHDPAYNPNLTLAYEDFSLR